MIQVREPVKYYLAEFSCWGGTLIAGKRIAEKISAIGGYPPVLEINNHATGGWRTKDILGGPKSWD